MKGLKRCLVVLMAALMIMSVFAGCSAAPAAKTSATTKTAGETKAAEETKAETTAAKITEAVTTAAETSASTAASAGKQYTIGVNIGYPNSEFFQLIESSIRKSCDEKGWKYIVTYGAEEKITENASTLLAQGVDAIVDFGCNAEIGSAMVKMAKAQNVPVICIDVKYDGAYFFGANNVQAGELLGDAMIKWIDAHWDGKLDSIFVSYGSKDGETVQNRTKKAVEKLQAKYNLPDSDVFWFDGSATVEEGVKQATADYLSAHPDQHHIANVAGTEGYALVSTAAADTMGRGKDMCVGTHSESSWTFDHFNSTDDTDTYVGCVAYQPAEYGSYIVKMLTKLFNGEKLDEYTLMNHVVITRDNYKQYEAAYNKAKAAIAG